jgi:hypothetical protein
MTFGDIQFLKAAGIEPSSLQDPFPRPLLPPPHPEAPIPKLAEEDSRWLQDLRVAWEHEPEPEFVPPKTVPEYLARFPTGIRQAVGDIAKELGLALSGSGLDDLAQEITQILVGFVEADLEDVIALYEFHRSLRSGAFCFPDYMKFRVKACVETVLQNRIADTGDFGESR